MSKLTESDEYLKEEIAKLRADISFLKKSITDYKTEKKTDWKKFKNKVDDEMVKIDNSLKKLKSHRKKKKS